ncbi:MATE efflux family protein [Cystobasidium minutum MCA 4210]|uniref:MATE efflux family protein n=1 Tax=Cystobasidium minutum MCA 4210 TaxID=1397322 RepID=UPI0034CE8B83|eukprot:jgi/Rhomi1/200329/MIX1158_1_10
MAQNDSDANDERRSLLPDNASEPDHTTIAHECRVLLEYALPLISNNIIRSFAPIISIICLGRLGTRELASANLGNLTVNVLGFIIQVGLLSSLDTLTNQAITKSPKLACIYTMRTFVMCCMAMPPMYLVLWNSRSILSFVLPHADPEMIRLSSLYIEITSLAILPYVMFDCLRRFLASMGMMRGPTVVYFFSVPLSITLTYLLTFKYLGFVGAPIQVVIVNWLEVVILAIYTRTVAPRDAWAGFSMAIFEDLGVNFRYGIAGVISTGSEWLAFEGMSLGASYLGQVPQTVNAIAITVGGVCLQLPFGISQASAIRVGNLLGANSPHKAKIASQAAQISAFIATAITALAIQVFRKPLGHLFTTDLLVIEMFDRMAYFVAIVSFFDGIQGACGGILRGAGLPGAASRINLLSYWFAGIPLGVWATMKTKKIEGLFTGLTVAVFIAASLMLWIIWRCDWEKRAREARERMDNSEAVAGLNRPDDLVEP